MSQLATPSPFESEDFTAITYDADDSTHFLSNCYPTSFYLDGNTWPSVMHYFVAKKFDLDSCHVTNILALPVRDVHKYSRDSRNINDISKFWDLDKQNVIFNALNAKFKKNPLKQKLLDTGTKEIVEISSFGSYWSQNANGSGKNIMGKLLSKQRFEIQSLSQHTSTAIPSPFELELSTQQPTAIQTPSPPSPPPPQRYRRTSSMSRLATPSPFESEDSTAITYDADDSTHFLSNCYPTSFYLERNTWPSVMHYFVAKKFDLKPYHVRNILALPVRDVHKYSRDPSYKCDISMFWNSDKQKIMFNALKAKFEKNPLKQKLLDTGTKEIVEKSSFDSYWSQNANGSGENQMGKLLAQLRFEIRSHSQYTPTPTLAPTPTLTLTPVPTPDLGVRNIITKIDETSLSTPPRQKSPDSIYFSDSGIQSEYSEFSSFSTHGFQLDGQYWPSLQHYIQAQKYIANGWIVKDILKTRSPREAYNMGESLEQLYGKKADWEKRREIVMKKALKGKFSDPQLKQKLLDTGNNKLFFDTKEDEFWGLGEKQKGKNKLGVLLMELRDELSVSSKPSYSTPQIIPSVDRSLKPSAYSSSISHSKDREIIYFYDSREPYFEFTPYSYHGFRLDGVYWRTLNHYFQAQKFSSSYHRDKIQQAKTPEEATKLANTSCIINAKILKEDEKENIMRRGLETKFSEHQDLAALLMKTGSRTLKFIHPDDIFWGIGSFTVGKNRLGILLMDLREKLQNSSWPNETKYSNPFKVSQSNDDTSNQKNAYAKPTQKWTMYLPPKGNGINDEKSK